MNEVYIAVSPHLSHIVSLLGLLTLLLSSSFRLTLLPELVSRLETFLERVLSLRLSALLRCKGEVEIIETLEERSRVKIVALIPSYLEVHATSI